MPVFKIAVPDGRTLSIEANDEQTAMRGAQEWYVGQNKKPESSTIGDVVKSAGVGLAQGAIGLAGLPGDLSELGARGIDRATRAIGGMFGADIPARPDQPTRFGSQDIKQAVEGVTGQFYEPQTVAGEYARTIGEFAPGALAGPGSLAARVGTQVIAPALASETAGQLTKGTEYEPYARVGGAVVGGMLPGAIKGAASKSSAPSLDDLRSQSNAAYREVDNAGVVLTPYKADLIAKDVYGTIIKEGLDPTLHPKATAAFKRLDELSGQPVAFQTMDTIRRVIKNAAASTDPSERRIAQIMIDKLDGHLERLHPVDVLAGDAGKASSAIVKARETWSKLRKSEAIEDLIERANTRASQFSGSGKENALRTEFRQLAMNKKRMRTFSPDEQKAIRRVATGGPVENFLRMVGKFAPTGVVSSALSGGTGFALGGGAGAVALPAAGFVARQAATAMTGRNARQASELMRSGAALSPASGASVDPKLLGLIESYLASGQLRESLTSPPAR